MRAAAQRERPETDIQRDILELLEVHPAVAWAKRMNVGRAKLKGSWVSFAFKGCSDIIGQLKSGQFLACEVKRPGEKPSESQQLFLDLVSANGGVAIVASEVSDVVTLLNSYSAAERFWIPQGLNLG